jgi:flagellar FliL protein
MVQDLEEQEGGGEEGAAEKSGGKKKLILMVAIPLVLIIGLAAGAVFMGLADPILAMVGLGGHKEKTEGGDAHGGGGGHGAEGAAVAQSVFYDLPDMLVNLNSPGRRQSYLKIRVSLELANPLDMPKVEAMLPRIVDNFQVYLRELRVEDLQGAAGVYRLREELLTRVNIAVKPTKVNDVLFKEMLVQ